MVKIVVDLQQNALTVADNGIGMSKDDPGFDEMIRLGREIRQQEHEDGA